MAGILFRGGRAVYAATRRAACFDATKLLVGPAPRGGDSINGSYEYSLPEAATLQPLIDAGLCPAEIGAMDNLNALARRVVIATHDHRVVGFAWIARGEVLAEENFSRTPALGTALSLPDSAAFVFNAWVSANHRGRSILSSMIVHAVKSQRDIETLVTMIDWTNVASLAAFKKLGMSDIGCIARARLGGAHWLRAPRAAEEYGIVCRVR